ncbi:hypothetical protein GH5_03420 [Leishmania sp. Ghana 2012 LV757]|uniref:hypothetical protein n=1 Tax=Leishmania sp. Ghana 2012 LV757 TaxID=2803181 RepID=UPI001B400E93|nr:hypothetical protein GH5_03420 [Leishmania sp. Ghana 2012 LV757]
MRHKQYVKASSSHSSLSAPTRRSRLRPSFEERLSPRRFPNTHAMPPLGARSASLGGRDRGVSRTLDSSVMGSLVDTSVSDVPESNPVSLLPQQEALRSRADHLAKRLRQIQAQEVRQRSFLAGEAVARLEDMMGRHVAYVDIAASCAHLQASRHAQAQAKAQQAQRWELRILQDTLSDTVDEEKKRRKDIEQKQLSVRRSLAQLHGAEVQPLQLREAVFRLIRGEEVRRSFLHREETRAVEAMGIPHFTPLSCVLAPAEATVNFGGGGRAAAKQSITELSKLDLMALQRCPFQCAVDCPFMPQRIRQLGQRWATAGGSSKKMHGTTALAQRHLRGASPSPVAHSSWQWRASGLQITEVGKQRVRNAMRIRHYSATTKFLPTLRL